MMTKRSVEQKTMGQKQKRNKSVDESEWLLPNVEFHSSGEKVPSTKNVSTLRSCVSEI